MEFDIDDFEKNGPTNAVALSLAFKELVPNSNILKRSLPSSLIRKTIATYLKSEKGKKHIRTFPSLIDKSIRSVNDARANSAVAKQLKLAEENKRIMAKLESKLKDGSDVELNVHAQYDYVEEGKVWQGHFSFVAASGIKIVRYNIKKDPNRSCYFMFKGHKVDKSTNYVEFQITDPTIQEKIKKSADEFGLNDRLVAFGIGNGLIIGGSEHYERTDKYKLHRNFIWTDIKEWKFAIALPTFTVNPSNNSIEIEIIGNIHLRDYNSITIKL